MIVKLDAAFAKVIKRGDYKVFLTPEGDCRGVYMRRKSTASFEVRELMGGKPAIAFSYRIVGRRKERHGNYSTSLRNRTTFGPAKPPKLVSSTGSVTKK